MQGTPREWRRPLTTILLWSVLGACGSGFLRNFCSLNGGVNDSVTIATWVWEWAALSIIAADLIYHILAEHTWGMAKRQGPSEKVD